MNCNCDNMSSIFRGTTPTIVLKVTNEDFDMTLIDVCHVTIQNDTGRNKKVFEDPVIDTEEKTISVELCQEDTLEYEEGGIEIQVRIKLDDGRVIANKPIKTTMNKILEEGIL